MILLFIFIKILVLSQDDVCLQDVFIKQRPQCEVLNDNNKLMMSYLIMKCHYQRSGRELSYCNPSDLKQCIKILTQQEWQQIFTQFFTLVQNYCSIMILNGLQDNVFNSLDDLKSNQNVLIQQLSLYDQHLSQIGDKQQQLIDQQQILLKQIFSDFQQMSETHQREQQNSQNILDNINSINKELEYTQGTLQSQMDEVYVIYLEIQLIIEEYYKYTFFIKQSLIYLLLIIGISLITDNPALKMQRPLCYFMLFIEFLLTHYDLMDNYRRLLLFILVIIKLYKEIHIYRDNDLRTLKKLESISKKLDNIGTTVIRNKVRKVLQQ
ncbi:hypothetical protein pb186bvf_006687 [Paramecium bursaria]